MSQSIPNTEDHLVQSGRPDKTEGRHVNLPLELGTTMVFDTLERFEHARDTRYETGVNYYGRYGNTASFRLEDALAKLDGADGVTLTSSGVAAISLTLLALTKPGSHLLVADHVYGNTRIFCEKILTKQNVDIEYYDPMIGAGVSALLRHNTTAIMFEAPGSGTFEVPNIPAIAQTARAAGVPTVIDNTWATPLFCRPLSLGVDVVVQSGSKFISGHSDCMLGVISTHKKLHQTIRQTVMAVGDKVGGQEIFLSLRGLRTLKMRMDHVDAAGRAMATWFAARPEVKQVLHPAFESCPGHEFWKRDFTGAAGLFGVVFHETDREKIRRFVDSLHHFGIGVSWGGYESLALPVTPLRTATDWTEKGQLVRFNIGFDNLDTLKADLDAGLSHLQ